MMDDGDNTERQAPLALLVPALVLVLCEAGRVGAVNGGEEVVEVGQCVEECVERGEVV
jgi:hypothetical protein